MRIRAVIVDDEPLARDLVRDLLGEFNELRIVAECRDGTSAAEAIARLRPHLVFLDIRMAEIDGFDVLARVRRSGWDPYVIFVTAYDAHAVRAFEFHANDFVVKPIHRERFRESVRRACDTITGRRATAPHASFAPSLTVREGRRMRSVPIDQIHWVEAANQYAKLHTDDGAMLLSQSLSSLARQLDPQRFFRVHRSALVNVARIRELCTDASGQRSVALADGTCLPVSRRRRAALIAALERPLPD